MEPKPLKAADRPAPAPGKAGGVYIPPFKLAAMMREAKVRRRRTRCEARPLLNARLRTVAGLSRLSADPGHVFALSCQGIEVASLLEVHQDPQ